MVSSLQLRISSPFDVLVSEDNVLSIRAEDETGGFGILPGHADFLTVLPVSVVRWHGSGDVLRYCALRGGVLRVADGGRRVEIACRQGVLGDDLATLASQVAAYREREADEARQARSRNVQMHARAVRQLVGLLTKTRQGEESGSP